MPQCFVFFIFETDFQVSLQPTYTSSRNEGTDASPSSSRDIRNSNNLLSASSTMNSSNVEITDQYDHFGKVIAAQLRRVGEEQAITDMAHILTYFTSRNSPSFQS